jgi:RNA polymerase primary sigma factor
MKQLVITSRLTNRESISFQQYLREVAQIPLLTPEEEIACTIKVATGDKAAAKELIERNLRFVISVAKQYSTPSNPLEDVVNEGNIGLIMAVDKYKTETGFRFISYAVWWVRKTILEYLAKNGRMIRLPNNKLNALSKLDKKIAALEQKHGRNIDVQELLSDLDSEDLGLLDLLGTYSIDSLDREIGSDEGNSTTLGDMIADDSFKATDHLIVDKNMKDEVARIISSLKPREQRIMIALYGLDGESPMTLKEVGDEIGVTREMIRQIKCKVLSGLKNKLKNSTISSY